METTTHSTEADARSNDLTASKNALQDGTQTLLHHKIVVLLHTPDAKKHIALKRIADAAQASMAEILQHVETMTPRQRGRLEHDIDSALHRTIPQPKLRNGRSVERIRIGFVDSNNLTR